MRISYLVLCMTFLLLGCESHQPDEVNEVPKSGQKGVSKSPVPIEFLGDNRSLQTLDIGGAAFNTVGDWYDNESILYITDHGGGSDVYRYNLYSGEKDLFLSTNSPIISLKANEDQSLFLVHTSNSNNKATITVVDKQGDEKYKWEVESYDLFYNWNPYQVDQVFVTSFLSDWSFQTHLLDVSKQTAKDYNIFQPFIQWLDKETITYLKWNQNEPDFFAPLYSFNLKSKTEGLLSENIISFSTFNQLLVTVELDKDKDSFGIYRFYNTVTNKKLQEYKLPLLTDYSKWNIPSSSYVPKQQLFYTFRPYSTGSFDTYSEKYELVSYDMASGKEQSILQKVDDLPIRFSPNGYLCLYGYQFENIIDVREKQVVELVKF